MNMKIWNEFDKGETIIECENAEELIAYVKFLGVKGYDFLVHPLKRIEYILKERWKNTYIRVDDMLFVHINSKDCYKNNEGYKIYTYKELMAGQKFKFEYTPQPYSKTIKRKFGYYEVCKDYIILDNQEEYIQFKSEEEIDIYYRDKINEVKNKYEEIKEVYSMKSI